MASLLDTLLRTRRVIYKTTTPFKPVKGVLYQSKPFLRQVQRDVFNRSVLSRRYPLSHTRVLAPAAITQVEDRRRFHPAGLFAQPLDTAGRQVSLIDRQPIGAVRDESDYERWHRISDPIRYKPLDFRKMAIETWHREPLRVDFEHPWKTIICLKRAIRRRMMHALGKAGLSGKFRKRRWSQYSYVKCWDDRVNTRTGEIYA